MRVSRVEKVLHWTHGGKQPICSLNGGLAWVHMHCWNHRLSTDNDIWRICIHKEWLLSEYPDIWSRFHQRLSWLAALFHNWHGNTNVYCDVLMWLTTSWFGSPGLEIAKNTTFFRTSCMSARSLFLFSLSYTTLSPPSHHAHIYMTDICGKGLCSFQFCPSSL